MKGGGLDIVGCLKSRKLYVRRHVSPHLIVLGSLFKFVVVETNGLRDFSAVRRSPQKALSATKNAVRRSGMETVTVHSLIPFVFVVILYSSSDSIIGRWDIPSTRFCVDEFDLRIYKLQAPQLFDISSSALIER